MVGGIRGERDDVLDANAEAPGKIDARLVAQRHSFLEHDFASEIEVGRLVTLETDAMAQPMGEVLVERPEPGLLQEPPRDGIDLDAEYPTTPAVWNATIGRAVAIEFRSLRICFPTLELLLAISSANAGQVCRAPWSKPAR